MVASNRAEGLGLSHMLGLVRQAAPLPVVSEMVSQQPQPAGNTQLQDGSDAKTQEGSDWLSLSHVTTLRQERERQSPASTWRGSP